LKQWRAYTSEVLEIQELSQGLSTRRERMLMEPFRLGKAVSRWRAWLELTLSLTLAREWGLSRFRIYFFRRHAATALKKWQKWAFYFQAFKKRELLMLILGNAEACFQYWRQRVYFKIKIKIEIDASSRRRVQSLLNLHFYYWSSLSRYRHHLDRLKKVERSDDDIKKKRVSDTSVISDDNDDNNDNNNNKTQEKDDNDDNKDDDDNDDNNETQEKDDLGLQIRLTYTCTCGDNDDDETQQTTQNQQTKPAQKLALGDAFNSMRKLLKPRLVEKSNRHFARLVMLGHKWHQKKKKAMIKSLVFCSWRRHNSSRQPNPSPNANPTWRKWRCLASESSRRVENDLRRYSTTGF